MKLELGCGTQTRPGFVGVDRFPMKGVSALVDLDSPFPFATNSVDMILAYHSLEHVKDIMFTMREVWRIAKPGAQVCIVAPYYAQGLNLANPYHKQGFNEHTPRFWTDSPTSGVDPLEYHQPPYGQIWGMSRSDHSNPGLDLRCVRMEFFYFQEYWGLSPARQRSARQKYMNVCEQFLIHLVVFKPPLTEADFQSLKLDLYMPPRLEERRNAAAQARRRWF